MADIPIILLAAGVSSRIGEPKQLLPWGEQTLIEHQIQMLMQAGKSVIVVLGAYADLIFPVIQKYPVIIVVNENWKSGMASSVACGIKEIERLELTAEAVLITLVDQPLIPFIHFEAILNAFEEGYQQIIASTSAEGWQGVPALFDRCYFNKLQNLQGEKGAKTIIQQYPDKVRSLLCNEIIKDVDTLESYRELYQNHFN